MNIKSWRQPLFDVYPLPIRRERTLISITCLDVAIGGIIINNAQNFSRSHVNILAPSYEIFIFRLLHNCATAW